MTVICNKFDARIKDLTDIQSVTDGCHDWEFMTKKGYFANSIFDFKELKRFCAYGEYAGWREHNQCFLCEQAGDETYYSYFLPENSLLPEEPEKKYRPFSPNEFSELYAIGDVVTYRIKDCKVVEQSMLIGFQSSDDDEDIPGDGYVLIGNCRYSLQELFNNYELKYLNQWQPFGRY